MWSVLMACLSQTPQAPTPEPVSVGVKVGAFDHPFQGDANFGACGCEEYNCDIRHTGADLPARVGTGVYPVSDGEVLYLSGGSGTGWGEGNVAVFVRHESEEGPFVALYGHIWSDLAPGDAVHEGEPLGLVGRYDIVRPDGVVRGIPHLHFGIHPGAEMPTGPTGQMPDPDCAHPEQTAGFVAPMTFLRTRTRLLQREEQAR